VIAYGGLPVELHLLHTCFSRLANKKSELMLTRRATASV